jgi:mRNA-degrading endonuclease RelE of RelBE toxin-antitoxin system
MYKLRISSKAENEIKKISHPHQKAIILALVEIKEEPLLGKPLTRELTGRFSYLVGVYRIIYKINKKDKIIDVLTAGHRAIICE